LKTIDRVHFSTLTPELFHRSYRSRSKPVVITGAFAGVEDWTLDVLRDKLGTAEYAVRVYGKEFRTKPKREWKNYCELKNYTAPEYIELLRDRTAHENSMYMAQVAIGTTALAETIRDTVVQLEQRCDLQTVHVKMDLSLWLGPGGHVEPLHFDTSDGTLMQLHGSKRIALFPPSQTRNIYPFPFFREIPPWFSQVDTDAPDAAAFPDYEKALDHRIDLVLEQGEILYIPVSWWHEVTALGSDYACSVNRFWKVKPLGRNFSHRRSTVFWLMNKVPWKVVLAFDGTMRKILRRTA
jgi:ribosomal protein L16 Arg81 hydroxylase